MQIENQVIEAAMGEGFRIEQLCISTMRTLTMDAVEQAQSGHPGAPMALAPTALVLYGDILHHDPATPDFPNRDRFVLSAGHASMLLYGVLHLSGYDISLDDIKGFRQLDSPCAGHPEHGLVLGVETTTGPLGQGAGNSVGMAIAERWLASHFNRPGHTLVDYRVYALLGDGCMMEGVTSEAASLAGHLRLGNLVWLYDSNKITIDGSTDLAMTEDVAARFAAYGWQVQTVDDANDMDALRDAITAAGEYAAAPSLVIVKSHIAYGSPNRQDTKEAHGAPLGADEVRATKVVYGCDPDRTFHVPDEAKRYLTDRCTARGATMVAEWQHRFAAYEGAHPDLAAEWTLLQSGQLPDGWDQDLPRFDADAKGMATRASAGKTLARLAERVPWLLGGSADLAGSTKAVIPGGGDFSAEDASGRNISFGTREHAMGSIANGLALSGLRPFAGTFLVFSDYCRPAIRLAALIGLPVIYVFSHDSIGLGEDGPTHQPIEHVMSLRVMPGLDVVRPCDANEAVAAWRYALSVGDRPVALVLTRQSVPTLAETCDGAADGLLRGGYVLKDCDATPAVLLIACGSEIAICMEARSRLSDEGIAARVVSLPCWEQFERQDEAYRRDVLPSSVAARVAVEAGVSIGWERYVGLRGIVIGLHRFGASAPVGELFEHFGVTIDRVVEAAQDQVLGRQ